ncbi:MAG: hypothetical protein SFY80_06460 [Verrucomicrobiota bacterium]|nr:hypothetical protein [Verrucomicrobiota bacterium]
MNPEGMDAVSITPPSPIQSVIERASIEEARNIILSRLAHDFANAVTGITSLSESCIDDAPAGSPLRESLEMIHGTILQAHGILRTMAAINQSSHGQQYVPPLSWIAENSHLLQVLLPKGTRLEIALHRSAQVLSLPCPLILWSDWVAQALLLTRRSPVATQVKLSTSHSGQSFCLTLCDNGPAIPTYLLDPIIPETSLAEPLAQRLLVLNRLTKQIAGTLQLDNPRTGGIRLQLTVQAE